MATTGERYNSRGRAVSAAKITPGPLAVRSPFPPQALYQLFDWALPSWHLIATDSVPRDREPFVAMQVEIAESEVVQTWGVWRGDELGGYVWSAVDPTCRWVARPHVLFKRTFFGHATTLPALRIIARELFNSGVIKIEMWLFEHNHGMKSLIRELGGRFEAVAPMQNETQGGQTIKMAIYGLYEDDLRGGD